MKKTAVAILLILIIFLVVFKLKSAGKQDYLVKINNYTITPEEFYQEFKASSYAKNNTPESRREFLNLLIRRKLVLQDAQSLGLDKDKEFLKSIERFWEQSLLKLMMDKKSREVSGGKDISDAAVKLVYEKLKSQGKADRPYDQMYNEIKWSLTQFQESQALNKWMDALYKKSNIKINPEYVKKDAPAAPAESKKAPASQEAVGAQKSTNAVKK